jgi:dephospho-CoA kinase
MIIGFTGRIAAGKESVKHFLVDKGFTYVETSQVLKEELSRRGMEITRTNMQDLGDELRAKDGHGALMKLVLEKINYVNNRDKHFILDSLRNAGEADFLREHADEFILIAVDAPQRLRFERILSRGKTHDPKTWEEFLVIDNRDYFDESNPFGQQVRDCMERADFLIVNDGALEDSVKKIQEIWGEIRKKIDL